MDLRTLSISQLSQVTGKDRRTISDRISAAKLEPVKEDKRAKYYNAPDAIQAIFAKDLTKGIERKIQQVQLEIERERLEKLRLENAKVRREMVTVEEVAKEVERQYSIVRSHLRSVPNKLAKPVSNDPSMAFVQISDAIEEVLTELSADSMYLNELRRIQSITTEAKSVSDDSTEAHAETQPS